jgi:hypothetical protein
LTLSIPSSQISKISRTKRKNRWYKNAKLPKTINCSSDDWIADNSSDGVLASIVDGLHTELQVPEKYTIPDLTQGDESLLDKWVKALFNNEF